MAHKRKLTLSNVKLSTYKKIKNNQNSTPEIETMDVPPTIDTTPISIDISMDTDTASEIATDTACPPFQKICIVTLKIDQGHLRVHTSQVGPKTG